MEKENNDEKKNGKDQNQNDLPDLDKGHPFYGEEMGKLKNEGKSHEGKSKKDQKEAAVKTKKTKKADKAKAKNPFREGSARAFAYQKLSEGVSEEEVFKLIVKKFGIQEKYVGGKIKLAEKALKRNVKPKKATERAAA